MHCRQKDIQTFEGLFLFFFIIPTLLSCTNLQVFYLKQTEQPLPISAPVWTAQGEACIKTFLAEMLSHASSSSPVPYFP